MSTLLLSTPHPSSIYPLILKDLRFPAAIPPNLYILSPIPSRLLHPATMNATKSVETMGLTTQETELGLLARQYVKADGKVSKSTKTHTSYFSPACN